METSNLYVKYNMNKGYAQGHRSIVNVKWNICITVNARLCK